MQNLSTASETIATQLAPSDGGPPEGLIEKIAAADVLILIGSSEQQERALSVQTILASPTFEPGQIASHAYAHAVQQAHQQLVRAVRGEPTDALRYQALRDFAILASKDPQRFASVNEMLQRFEQHGEIPEDPLERASVDHDRMADFLIHALAETESQAGAAQTVIA